MTTAAALPQSLFPLEVPMPSREETSLSSKAMLCTVSISAWSGYKFDRETSEEIAQIHGAEKDSGRFNKRLVPRKELEEITKIIGRARRDHEFVTLPWSDNGYRVLPAAAYMDHTTTMRLHAAEFNAAVSRLAARFEVLVTNQSRLGTLFKVEDYPGMRNEGEKLRFTVPEELRSRFSFETKVLPLPDADDFRVSIGDQDRERIKRQIAQSIQASLRVGIHAMALTVLGRSIITPVCHDDISFQTQGAPLVLIPRGQKLPYPAAGYARNEGLSCPKTQQSGTVPIRISLVAGKEQRQLFNELWEVPSPITQGTRLWLEYRFDENQCLEVRLGRVGQEDAGFRGILENPLTHVVNPNKTKVEIEELEELLRSGQIPKDEAGDALQRLGNLYRTLGQRDKALAFFSRALKAYGEPDVHLLNKMAMCAREQGNKRTAEKFYAEATKVSPWSGTFFNWALAKEGWNEPDQALDLAAKAHGLEEDPAYLVLEARLESKLGNQARADSLITEALSRYGPPANLDDFGLTWLRIAARMAGTSNKVDEVDRIMRERRLRSNVPNTQVGLLLDREDRDDSGQERRSDE